MELPYYKIIVNADDETGVDFNSFVDVPAHMKGFIAFNESTTRYTFAEDGEKRIVTGVMISAGTPIYRNSEDAGEHYVIFDADTIQTITRKMFKNNYLNNVNKMHNDKDVTNGAIPQSIFIASNSDPKLPNIPEAFEKLKLQDGSLFASYYIEDDKLWDEVKQGKFKGFSVEGWFDKKRVNIKSNINMSKQSKTVSEYVKDIFADVFGTKEKFASATNADGVVVSYDGEIAEDVQMYVDVDGEQVPAPEGDYVLTLEDGSEVAVTLDASGIVVSMGGEEAPVEEGMVAEPSAEFKAELTKQLAETYERVQKEFTDKFEAFKAEFKAEVIKQKADAQAGKFQAKGKSTEVEHKTVKSILFPNK